MRIVSLVPAATEILCALGLRGSLVGRSHECDFPLDVADVSVMTFDRFHDVMIAAGAQPGRKTALEIDQAVSQQVALGTSSVGLIPGALASAKPDLIITQALCGVCAVPANQVHDSLSELSTESGSQTVQTVSLQPTTISGIFDSILQLGALTECQDAATNLVHSLQIRIDRVRDVLADVPHRPSVAALEWMDPPFAAGHWVPEQIALAGGQCALGDAGELSNRISWDDVLHCQPEMVVCMPCGFDLSGAIAEFESARTLHDWRDMPAPYLHQLVCVDGSAYFSRPGPRVVDGIEILAGLLHPTRYPHPTADRAVRVEAFALDEA